MFVSGTYNIVIMRIIDRIDTEIIRLIAERGTFVVQASNLKKSKMA